jgi:hypothetical protein
MAHVTEGPFAFPICLWLQSCQRWEHGEPYYCPGTKLTLDVRLEDVQFGKETFLGQDAKGR